MFAFKTLQRRLTVLLVVPLTLFLLGFGFFGYRFIHGVLFQEWGDIAILRLERAAHQMDMKLHEQMGLMQSFARAGQDARGEDVQPWHLKQIKAQPGEVVVSEMVLHHAGATLAVKRTFETKLKGIAYPVKLSVLSGRQQTS